MNKSNPQWVLKALKKVQGSQMLIGMFIKYNIMTKLFSPINDEVHVYETATKIYNSSLSQASLDEKSKKFYII